MCASVGVKAKGESDQMMRNEGGGVFPESLMPAKPVFDAVKTGVRQRQTPVFGTIIASKTGV